MAMTDLSIVQRSLTSRRFSTITTILTVAIAVALLVVLLSLRDAGRQALLRGAGNMHLVVSRDSSPLTTVMNTVFYANPPQRSIDWATYERLAGMFPYEYAIPTQQGDSYRGFPVLATTTEFFTQFQPHQQREWTFADGRAFERSLEVVVGSEAQRATGLRVGDTIYLTHGIGRSRQARAATSADDAMDPHVHYEYEYTVVGTLEQTGTAHDRALFTDLTSTWIIHAHDRRVRENPGVSRTTQENLTDADREITGILLRLPSRRTRAGGGGGSDTPAILQQVHDTLRRDTTISAARPSEQINRLLSIVGQIDQVFIAMGAVVLISSAIAIMLALYNSMEQRRRQIAVMRVLGCSRPRIFSLVLTESAMIGLFGAAVGVAIALIGMQIVVQLMYGEFGIVIEPTLSLRFGLTIVVVTIFLAALAGAVPAASAYRTSVADHLKPLG